jgi:hypothetical protein
MSMKEIELTDVIVVRRDNSEIAEQQRLVDMVV